MEEQETLPFSIGAGVGGGQPAQPVSQLLSCSEPLGPCISQGSLERQNQWDVCIYVLRKRFILRN